MRFKLDENIDRRLAITFDVAGHDVETVVGEKLSGASDEVVFEAARGEKRVLVSLDLDFSNPLRFASENTSGIVILRPVRPTLALVKASIESLLSHLPALTMEGRLVIVEPGRMRIYDPRERRDQSG